MKRISDIRAGRGRPTLAVLLVSAAGSVALQGCEVVRSVGVRLNTAVAECDPSQDPLFSVAAAGSGVQRVKAEGIRVSWFREDKIEKEGMTLVGSTGASESSKSLTLSPDSLPDCKAESNCRLVVQAGQWLTVPGAGRRTFSAYSRGEILLPDLTDAVNQLSLFVTMRQVNAFSWVAPVAPGKACIQLPIDELRAAHTATLLPDGRVLLAGGFVGGTGAPTYLRGTALFDPATGTLEKGPTLNHPRAFHTATLLPDGNVLLAGGVSGDPDAAKTAELVNPLATKPVDIPLLHPRSHHAAVLRGGSVLLVGGRDPGQNDVGLSSTEFLMGPLYAAFEEGPALRLPRSEPVAVGVKDGTTQQDDRVLVLGGNNGREGNGLSGETEMFALTPTGGFARLDDWTAALPAAKTFPAAATAATVDGRTVVVMSGYRTGNDRVRSPNSTVWTVDTMTEPQQAISEIKERAAAVDGGATLVPLLNGSMLAAGGTVGSLESGSYSAKAELVVLQDGRYVPARVSRQMLVARHLAAFTRLADGSVLVSGGLGDASPAPETDPRRFLEIYQPDYRPESTPYQ